MQPCYEMPTFIFVLLFLFLLAAIGLIAGFAVAIWKDVFKGQ